MNLYEDEAPIYCRHCYSTQPLYTDRSQGDIICTSCGVVAQSHIFELGPEWVDYDNDSELNPFTTYSVQARCGMVPVNESRYIGGLESTKLSTQPFIPRPTNRQGNKKGFSFCSSSSSWKEDQPSDPIVIANKEARIRTCLQKTHAFLERWTKKNYEESLENAKIDLDLQNKKKRKQTSSNNKDFDEEDTSSTESSSSSTIIQDVDDDDDKKDDIDRGRAVGKNTTTWNPSITHFYSDSHETIVQQRELIQTQVLRDKWSLTACVFLHGSEQDVDYVSSVHRYMSTTITPQMTLSSQVLEEEKTQVWKHMDLAHKRASVQLYYASRILLRTIQDLQLSQYTDAMMNVLYHYATQNQGLTVKGLTCRHDVMTGISSTISTHQGNYLVQGSTSSSDMNNNTTHSLFFNESSFHSRQDLFHPQRDKNKVLQMAALSSAIIYSTCNKENIGRSVMDICSSVNRTINHDEIQIKPKFCFKAMVEMKNVLSSSPSTRQEQQLTVTRITPTTTNNNTVISSPISLPTTSIPKITNCFDQNDFISISTLIQHSLEPMKLPPGCLIAITYLTLDLKSREQKGQLVLSGGGGSLTMSTSQSKLMTAILSLTYFVGQVGQVLHNLAPQILNSKSLQEASTRTFSSSPSSSSSSSLKQPSNHIHSFDLETEDALQTKGTHEEEDECHKIAFWNAWQNEPSWKREYEAIEKLPCFHTSITTLRDFYKKNLSMSQRRILLQNLQDLSLQDKAVWNPWFQSLKIENTLGQEKIQLLFKNITLAVPLIN